MTTIEHTFEEISLCIGTDKAGKRQCIALISGTAHVNAVAGGWEIEKIDLQAPCLGQADAEITYTHPLFDFVCESIAWAHGDKIWDEVLEARRPDPDYEYERRRTEHVA